MIKILVKDLEAILCGNVTIKQWQDETESYKILYSNTHFVVMYLWIKYYSIIRPVSIGTHPKDGMMDFINYGTRTEVNGHMVWAEIYYNRELTQKEMEDFEMIRG